MTNEMFRVRERVTYRGGLYPGRSSREFKSGVLRRALGELGQFWHRRIFPERFSQGGGRELRFALRDLRYQASKKKQGENLPLVGPRRSPHSGGTRRMTAGPGPVPATAGGFGGAVPGSGIF